MGAEELPLCPVRCHCETSDRSHWLWQSVFLVQRATARVAPTESYKECGAKWNPPVTASPCQSPLGKGAEGTGDADCHSQFANWPRNDKVFCKRCDGRAVEDAGPYGGFTDRTSQGLPTPFLHISCSLCVDSLWINFPSPFLPPSCGNPSFPLWTKNPCISRPYGGFPQKFSLRLLLLKNT